MAKRVKMPDGQIVSFPDTHTDDQIGAFIDEQFPELAAPKDSALTSAFVGAAQGATANTLGHVTQKVIDFTNSLASNDNPIASYLGNQLGGKRGGREDVAARLKQVQEANPGAYTTGEVAGAILAPTGKIGAIPKIAKMGTLGKLGAVGGVNMAESALNAYNTDGNIAQSMGISGVMSALPMGISKFGRWSGATDKITDFMHDKTLAAEGLLGKMNAYGRLGSDPKWRAKVAETILEQPGQLWKGAKARVANIDERSKPLNEIVDYMGDTVAKREAASGGKFEGARVADLRDGLLDLMKKKGVLKDRPVVNNRGDVSYIPQPSTLLASDSAATFGKTLKEIQEMTPLRQTPDVFQFTGKKEWVPSAVKSSRSGSEIFQSLPENLKFHALAAVPQKKLPMNALQVGDTQKALQNIPTGLQNERAQSWDKLFNKSTPKSGGEAGEWVMGTKKVPGIYKLDPEQRLSLNSTLGILKSAQDLSKYDQQRSSNVNDYMKGVASSLRQTFRNQAALPTSGSELRTIARAKDQLSPLMVMKNLAEDESRRNANRTVMGLTPIEATVLAGTGGLSAYKENSSVAYPLAYILARRYGNAAMSTGLNKVLKSTPSTGNGLITAPLRYFSSKGNE